MVLVLSSISGTKPSPLFFNSVWCWVRVMMPPTLNCFPLEMPSKIYSEVCLSILSESQLRKTDNKNEPFYIVSKELCTF